MWQADGKDIYPHALGQHFFFFQFDFLLENLTEIAGVWETDARHIWSGGGVYGLPNMETLRLNLPFTPFRRGNKSQICNINLLLKRLKSILRCLGYSAHFLLCNAIQLGLQLFFCIPTLFPSVSTTVDYNLWYTKNFLKPFQMNGIE